MYINEILKQLKSEISEYEFQSYFSTLEYDENSQRMDLLEFYAPNIFIADWIETNYIEKLKLCTEKVAGIRSEIHIYVKEFPKDVKNFKNNKTIQKTDQILINYNESETFENFVVGNSNRHAFLISKTICENQGGYNPVLIYGQTGVGKTHLLNAIYNFVAKKRKKVIYITAEQFLNDFQLRKTQRAMDLFRNTYRKCDYLLIDDVQFFGGKEHICEEFFHTFNELRQNKGQIVLTSDQPPKKIRGLEERLRSRFESGVITQIENAELDTKIEIIKTKCELNAIPLDSETINYIATKINNIRQIIGIIQNINLQSNLNPNSSKFNIAKSLIKSYQKESIENITIDQIITIVAKELNIKPSEITSKEKSQRIARARRIVIYIAHTLTLNSMPVLANKLNMKDHSSVSKALKTIKEKMREDDNLKILLEEIQNKVKNNNIPEV
ncbi:MAG: chromosomal replication initiator protein DnaA [Helicobacter sp.]|uniref:chromosomal replication initiator protein DnaA n=1 Tax=Helicobacter sp. 10-6591 TaxID=2004998 RepID=UPI000DCD2B93|nr:chromosomal replication initiator protein DnaA [Helicobacter sp. 10-6591]MCI6217630.1 chromosomal replication initiator protein DnaA [Helicobacter sp.]MCI7485621.1 chromosomal replication initiator protein DnaA [Helicobacter sp.]MDD7567414.1 chromosomal replication initiator protein DnaA [Helicobacter sp.]MDY5740515.1 chromosomal replication initiator protein DnaA [Helicobacter sp.]RAX56040.1 chromosomal replication initiator protein DnaA [Helicobacter sp. 10-6591]